MRLRWIAARGISLAGFHQRCPMRESGASVCHLRTTRHLTTARFAPLSADHRFDVIRM
jgi:hypothetical protein